MISRHLSTFALLFCVAMAIASGNAEELPLADLGEKGTGTNALGSFSIEFYGERSKFPQLSEKAERPTATDGRFDAPEGRSSVHVGTDGAIKFDVAGFQNNADGSSKWLPVLVFTPKEKGKYKIGGLIKFWCDNASEEESVSFHVVSITNDSPDGTEYEGLSKHDGELDLSAIAELQDIAVSDAIGLTIWRNKPHHAAGGTITDLIIEKLK